MAKTYSPQLTTDLDRVRFLCGDNDDDEDARILEDDEIAWLLAQEPNVYYAAAEALAAISKKCADVDEAAYGEVTMKWRRSHESFERDIAGLRARGAEALTPSPKYFRVF